MITRHLRKSITTRAIPIMETNTSYDSIISATGFLILAKRYLQYREPQAFGKNIGPIHPIFPDIPRHSIIFDAGMSKLHRLFHICVTFEM